MGARNDDAVLTEFVKSTEKRLASLGLRRELLQLNVGINRIRCISEVIVQEYLFLNASVLEHGHRGDASNECVPVGVLRDVGAVEARCFYIVVYLDDFRKSELNVVVVRYLDSCQSGVAWIVQHHELSGIEIYWFNQFVVFRQRQLLCSLLLRAAVASAKRRLAVRDLELYFVQREVL